MRRLAFAAACGTVFLAACSDQPQSPTEPSAPAPDATILACRPVRFPIVRVSALILQVFPPGKNRVEALARGAAVALLWDTCKKEAAQRLAVGFVQWIDLNAPGTASPAKVIELKITILNGVGVPTPPPSGSPDDFGVGLFDPAKTTKTLIKTKSGKALVQLDPGSFDELTVITLSRKADDFQLTDFDGRQFPPKYDYDAVNASGNKILLNGNKAIVAFCLLGLDDVKFPDGYPDHPRIGHNPVEGAPGFPFEVLDEVNLAAEGLDDDLSAEVCGYTPVIGFGGGPVEFAKAVFRTATDLLLPEPLMAAAIMGTLPPPPPIGGRAGSLSPFGVVEFSEDELSFTNDPGPSNQPFHYFKGVTVDTCGDGCYPAVQMLDPDGTPVGAGTNVTVSLIQTQGTGGVLGGTLTQPIHDFNSGTSRPGEAVFDDLTISAPGWYELKFTAPGATPITSLEFPVYTMAFTWEPYPVAGHTFFDGDFLGQPQTGFDGPVVQVSIVDYTGSRISTATDVIQVTMTDGFLSGTTSQQAVSGVASYTDLQVFRGEGGADLDGVSLKASTNYFGTNPVQATSTTFNIHQSALTLSYHTDQGTAFDPGGNVFFAGTSDGIRWRYNVIVDGVEGSRVAYPAVQVLNSSGTPQVDIDVTISLVPVGASSGTLSGTLTASTSEFTDFPTAFFDDLTIDLPGTYRLRFTTPGAAALESGDFTVTEVIGLN